MIGGARIHHPQIESGLSPLGGDFEHIVLARINPAVMERLGAFSKARQEFFQFGGGRGAHDDRFDSLNLRDREFEGFHRLHVGYLAELLHELGHIDEPGKAGVEPVGGGSISRSMQLCGWLW